MKRPIIIIGAGGHARVLIDALRLLSAEVIGATDANPLKAGMTISGVPVLGTDEVVTNYQQDGVWLVNGLGSVGAPALRTRIFCYFTSLGYSFTSVIHPSAILAPDVTFGEGVQVMAGSILQTGCQVGANSLINTGTSVDHDCCIGTHVHLAPRVTLSGGVQIGDGVHIGTGAVIVQGIKVEKNSIIGAGAVVLKDVAENTKVWGVPAREVQS